MPSTLPSTRWGSRTTPSPTVIKTGPTEYLRIEDEDCEAIEARLAELPATEEEFFLLSTRLEVLEIAVDAIKARMMSSGLGEVSFTDADYEEDD